VGLSRQLSVPAASTLAQMSGVPLGDAELLARHVDGDPDAFNELVARHRDRLWAVALRTLGHPEDAADALQDAFLSAYRGAAGFQGNSAVTTWLHRIVVNACLDNARRRAVRPTDPLPDDPASAQPARDTVAERETSLAVTAALRTLPAEQAAAVVLVDIEGFSVSEAAATLDVPVGTVKSRCARARARLAEQLSDLDPRRPTSEGVEGNESPTSRVQSTEPHGAAPKNDTAAKNGAADQNGSADSKGMERT
jgi:RNA polymerase sigma-70 factor, ECF subfamily